MKSRFEKNMAGLVVTFLAVMSVHAGLMDVFDSAGEKLAKANDAWFEQNKTNIHIRVSGVRYQSQPVTNAVGAVEKPRILLLDGTIENLSDDRIMAIIVDFVVTNPANNQEALRERMKIDVQVFKSETLKIPTLQVTADHSNLIDCFGRIPNAKWNCELVSAIAEKNEELDSLHFKISSRWIPVDK